MSAETKQRVNIFKDFIFFFKTGVDIDEYNEVRFNDEQEKARNESDNIMEKSSESIITTGSKKSGKSELRKNINPNTEKAMRAMHNKIKQNTIDDRERE